ncbi:MAG: long-chain fatty acid--CoA ligase [Gemmatimonadota bacterium]|nr:long-chain fatty acid--CoA ligase [Gemmatimonadota bacterium]
MALHTYAANPADLPRGTLVDLLLDAVDRFGAHPAFRTFVGPGQELTALSYSDLLERIMNVAGALQVLGLKRGQSAAILSENRLEWALADYGCLCTGVYTVPIHSVLTVEQVAYILNNSGAHVVFASGSEQTEKARAACARCTHRPRVVSFDLLPSPPDDVLFWDRLLEQGREYVAEVSEADFRARAHAATPDDVATILYTSGTTGDPKGVVLTHSNLFSNVEAAARALTISSDDSTLSFLPLSHVFQRMVDYLLLGRGCTISYPHSRETIVADLRTVRPTVVVAVPRVYEKVYFGALAASGLKGKLVRWARGVGVAWATERLAGRSPAFLLELARRLADRLVFRKIRDLMGGRIRVFVSGSAPLDPEIARFFYAAGLPILEGYGLTETSPVTNVNTPDEIRVGTVGRPVAGTEIKIADDGEILVRGPQVMREYYKLPAATAEAIDDEGWFYTGDIGELDADDFLRITDRKKDLIKTSGGKYIAPQPIENRLKRSRFIDQAVVIGDRRKFVALLVVPDFTVLESWAKERGVSVADRAALLRDPLVQAHMEEQSIGGLRDLSQVEIPKKVALLETHFSIEDGTLTLTDKVKRRVVQDRYASLIDRFYEPEAEGRTVFVS